MGSVSSTSMSLKMRSPLASLLSAMFEKRASGQEFARSDEASMDGAAYSLDFRKRVVAGIEGGMSRGQAAKQFRVAREVIADGSRGHSQQANECCPRYRGRVAKQFGRGLLSEDNEALARAGTILA